jgi:predicted alpha/beta hydrolase family esterase
MVLTMSCSVKDALLAQAAQFDFVLVPGFKDSGPEHWQSLWPMLAPVFSRISLRRWDDPDIELWISAIKRHLRECRKPSVLIGHSLGALASACAAVDDPVSIAGVVLVAPAEPARFEAEDRVPQRPLGVPGIVVASHNDPIIRFDRTVRWAQLWGVDLIDQGEAGHINAEAGFGPWPYGLTILSEFVASIQSA